MNFNNDLYPLNEPKIMGILNLTPDSFFDGGKFNTIDEALKRTSELIDEGADIIDLGGYSSRPGADHITQEEEKERVLPILKELVHQFPKALFSVDTFRSDIARMTIENGACLINDISGGNMDDKMFETIAELKVPYVVMHMKGSPQTMQDNPVYADLMKEVHTYFIQKIQRLNELGVNDVIIDPGFGFAKNVEHNYHLLKHLNELKIYGLPIMVGVSRKSMINKVIGSKPSNAQNGSTVLHTIALLNGAGFIRTHDVTAAKEAIKIVMQYQKS